MDLFDLTGKVALVTGSTKGLGETAAKALAKAGADVAVCGRNPADLKRVSAEIQATGRNSAGFELDVLSKEKVTKGIEKVLSHFGRIDILVNNAGTNYRVPVLEYPEEMWDLIINTNLKGYFLVAQAVVPQMIERGYGKVINMSSIFGKVGLATQLAYASSKGGVEQMTKVTLRTITMNIPSQKIITKDNVSIYLKFIKRRCSPNPDISISSKNYLASRSTISS